MITYKVKKEGLYHKAVDDDHARPYTVGEMITLKEADAKLLADYLAGESEAIDSGELVSKAKYLAMEANLINQYEAKLKKAIADKNALTASKDQEIYNLKQLLDKQDRKLTETVKEMAAKIEANGGNKINALQVELETLKKELATTKGLLTKANKKIQELEN